MTPEEMARIVADPNVTNEAFRLIMFVASLGPGEHEITSDELRMVLGCKSDTPVQKARQRAVNLNYIEWRQGGKGHGNVFRYLRPAAQVNAIPMPHGTGKPTVVVVEEGRSNSPLSPPVVAIGRLADDAQALIEAERELLGDAVKPLVSYLRRRVRPENQEPYVGRVIGALKPECMNPQWKDAAGASIPLELRPAIMADALNELATADESKGRKWDAGDWGNLRNKLYSLIRLVNAPPLPRATGTDGKRARAGPRSDSPPDAQDYTLKPFRGLNG